MRLTTAFLTMFVLGLGACSDDGGSPPPVDADPNAPDAPNVCPGGTVGFLEECEAAADCGDSCTCELFHPKHRCTKACTTDADCPAPSPGCLVDQGYCRR